MEPVSLSIAAVTLLVAKVAEGFGQEAGADVWRTVRRLGDIIRPKMSPPGQRALERIEGGDRTDEVTRGAVAALTDALERDTDLGKEIQKVLDESADDPVVARVVSTARDRAKVINIGGDNSGSIRF